MQAASSYLYSDGSDNRYWYDTRPTLRKIVEDRAQLVKDEDAFGINAVMSNGDKERLDEYLK